MDQPIMKPIIKLYAIYLSTIRGEAAVAASESFLDYLKSYQQAISKKMIDMVLSDCSQRMLEKGFTVEQLTDEVLQDIKESMEYVAQLQFFIVLLDVANHFVAFGTEAWNK
jgi:hypothetical protein